MENVERYRPWIILGAIVLGVLIIAFVVLATIFGWWPVVVDIVLVITALLSLIMLGALTYATIMLIRTICGQTSRRFLQPQGPFARYKVWHTYCIT